MFLDHEAQIKWQQMSLAVKHVNFLNVENFDTWHFEG
jgi:hypothetical protein